MRRPCVPRWTPLATSPWFRSVPDAVLLIADGRIVDATERVERLLGRAPSELVGAPFLDCFVDEVRPEVADRLAGIGAGGAADTGEIEFESVVQGSGDEQTPVEVVLRGSPSGLVAVLHRRSPSADRLLAAMLEAVSATEVVPPVIEGALREVATSLDWDRGAVWVVDDRTGLLHAVTAWERDPEPSLGYRTSTLLQGFAPDEGLPGQAWSLGATFQPRRFDVDPRFSESGLLPSSGVFHPIRAGRRVVGVLELLADRPIDATAWVDTALVAVEPAIGHLLERLRDRLAVDEAEGRLAVVLDAGEFGVATFERRVDWAEWSARMGELHGLAATGGQGTIGDLLAAVHRDDVAEVRDTIARVQLQMSEPEAVDYRVVADDGSVRWLATRVTATRLPGDQVLVAAISSDVTEDRQSAQRVRRRAMAVEGLQWVTQALISGRELHDTALAVTHAATGVLGATHGVVLYLAPSDAGEEMAWAISGLPADVHVPDTPTSVDLPEDLEEATRSIALDLRQHLEVRAFVESLGLPIELGRLRSALVVPVRGEGHKRLGTMVFLHPDAGYFTDDDVRLAHAIGTSTGVAVENAQRHEQQRMVAAAFQREQLPPSDIQVPGLDVCVRYHPGRAGLDVGGDWYDVIPLDDGRVGLAVGDVCGHGLSAAAHMGQFRYSFRALVQASIDPATALATINRMAIHELRTTVTVVYVELDIETGGCRVWRCGHLPPAVAPADGSPVRWLGTAGHRSPMLGFVEELRLTPSVDVLAPRDVLLLYTDGLIERRGETIEDGMQRLRVALGTQDDDLDSLCDQIYGVLVEAATAEDDTAILAVRRD